MDDIDFKPLLWAILAVGVFLGLVVGIVLTSALS